MKYIDAERLQKEVKRLRRAVNKAASNCADSETRKFHEGKDLAYRFVDALIELLMIEQPESSKGKFVFPNFLYARTVDNKTIDVSYAPQSMDAVEYIKNDPTEQPEVDLEKEISTWIPAHISGGDNDKVLRDAKNAVTEWARIVARHFAVWGAEHYRDSMKMISEDLEEAAEEYEKKHTFQLYDGGGQTPEYDATLAEAFEAGAEWAMNQGVKTTGTISPRGIIYDTNVGYHLFLERYHNGDKVKIIIVKEDKK